MRIRTPDNHLSGLLTPQHILDVVAIKAEIHEFIAIAVGIVVGSLVFAGLILLIVAIDQEANFCPYLNQ